MDNPLTKTEVQAMIDKAMDFCTRKRGDTPTDANQLVPKQYCDANSGGYGGRVDSDGTAIDLPTGWTSQKDDTGQYTVTHNLGTTSYGVAALSVNANLSTINLSAIAANTFSVITWNNTPTNTDEPWSFVLIPV